MAKAKAHDEVTALETTAVPAPTEDQSVAVEVPSEQAPVTEVQPELATFLDWAKGAEREDLSAFVDVGLLEEDSSLSDQGVDLLDNEGIPWANVNLLVLGIPITYGLKGNNYAVKAGSVLRVLFGGYDESYSARYWDCSAGERLPLTRIYQHSLHKFEQKRYPAAQSPKTTYSHED